jgi:hypothetical protein
MVLPIFIASSGLYKNHLSKLRFKHHFVVASIVGATLVGSVNSTFRIWGFILCTIGNVYWIWYHKNITRDVETKWIFIAYLIINSMAIINNYMGGSTIFAL